MSEEINTKRRTFFQLLFGRTSGYVCLAFILPDSMSGSKKGYQEEFWQYPEQLPAMLESINKRYMGHNIYFCPQLLSERRRNKEHVTVTTCAWADLDSCPPEKLDVEASICVESSPGRYQAYWIFEKRVDPDDAEDISRRIAYRHAEHGADKSGWDLTQLLRVPYTYNYKYTETGSARGGFTKVPIVTIVSNNRNLYRVSDFENYPQAAGYQYLDIPMPDEGELKDPDELLQAHRRKLNPIVWGLYSEPVQPDPKTGKEDWSKALWNLQMLLFETGFTREQVFVVARAAKCNKYARRGNSERLLWKEVCRAYAKNEANTNIFVPREEDMKPLLSEEEREELKGAEDTFIERYQTWARSLGDAAPQYHQAGAFVVLSSLIGGSVKLPTSYGTIVPNLWFMILADTTLTRKSTAMDIAMDLVMEIDDNTMMATDGSIEGLLTALSTRPGTPSVFLRDEFSGLLEQMTKKDYMAGMPELLTKLYDGKMQKRILRKEVIEVRDPILIVFAGGIKTKVTSILTHDQVSSGFLPRFIFITAESDITKVKPLGPPTEVTETKRNAVLEELRDLYAHYRSTTTMTIEKLKTSVELKKEFEAYLTPEAWERYNLMESQMLQAGLNTERPDIMTPTYDRLSKSMLKGAILLAASRWKEQQNSRIEVTKLDIMRAILYGEEWRAFANEVMANVGKGSVERELDKILNAIVKRPGVSRSWIMQCYHLRSNEAKLVFETLEDRGLITVTRVGRGMQLYPTGKGI